MHASIEELALGTGSDGLPVTASVSLFESQVNALPGWDDPDSPSIPLSRCPSASVPAKTSAIFCIRRQLWDVLVPISTYMCR